MEPAELRTIPEDVTPANAASCLLMALLQSGGELLGSYSEALAVYLSNRQQSNLLEAQELGKAALKRGVGVAELCGIHHEVIARVLTRLHDLKNDDGEDALPCPLEEQELLTAVGIAGTFLGESMSPFDVNHRDVCRSNSALRHHNQNLESELYRLTRTVYDEALQLLATARMAMAGLAGELNPSLRGHSAEVQTLLDQIDDHLAACCTGLLPCVLTDLGLNSAIESLCRRFSKTATFDLRLENAIDPLPRETSIAVYRTVLEALTNIHQHAQASRVTVRLYRESYLIHCCICDNGIGFDASAVLQRAHERGSGLAVVAESLRCVGATLAVESAPASGTTLRFSLTGTATDY